MDSATAAENSLITQQLEAVRKTCEKYIGQIIVNATCEIYAHDIMDWDYKNDGSLVIDLPFPPHTAVTEVVRINQANESTTLTANSDYYVLGSKEQRVSIQNRRITVASGFNIDGFKITYAAGMGGDVPEPLIEGMLKLLAEIYDKRTNTIMGSVARIPDDVRNLWNHYRRR